MKNCLQNELSSFLSSYMAKYQFPIILKVSFPCWQTAMGEGLLDKQGDRESPYLQWRLTDWGDFAEVIYLPCASVHLPLK